MKRQSLARGSRLPGAAAIIAVGCLALAGHAPWTVVGASPGFPGFTRGNLVVSRSIYQGDATTVTVGQALPGGGVAVANGSYPGVWANEGPDASFGVTSPILLDEMTPDATGTVVTTLSIPAPAGSALGLVTSFPSKSELGLHLSPDGSQLTFMGYAAPVNALDVSNSNTPNHIDSTNPVTSSYQRAIGEVDPAGHLLVTPVNAYSGNNGREAVLANGNYYLVGNAGNGSGDGPTLSMLSDNTGVQMVARGTSGDTTVVGQVNGAFGSTTGYQRGFSLALTNPLTGSAYGAADKTGKDDNFRGATIFDDTLYVSKGSGSNGVDTIYRVDGPQSLPTIGNAGTAPLSVLPGLPATPARGLNSVDSSTTQTVGGQLAYKTVDPTTEFYPFDMWFADGHTLYVADEGAPVTTTGSKKVPLTAAALDTKAGLQKWSLVAGQWTLDYTLQNGLNLGQAYSVSNADNSITQTPAPAGLRHLTGRLNGDGTVSIWATTSTVSTATDQGADPNQLVMITDTLSTTTAAGVTSEHFTLVRTAKFGEVLRGVNFTPAIFAPAWAVNVIPAPNGYGWNNSSVNVSLMASLLADVTQLVKSITYTLTLDTVQGATHTASGTEADFSVTSEGSTLVSYSAQSGDSNSATLTLPIIKIDQTPPVIAYSGNAGSYTVDQTVNITCAPTDVLSGIASSSCPGASGPAYSFPLGSNQLTATATDKAGNQATGSTAFTVSVTFASLEALTQRFVSQHGIANALVAKLSEAADAASRGDGAAAAGSINAYVNQLSAQSGKALTAANATLLQQLAGSL